MGWKFWKQEPRVQDVRPQDGPVPDGSVQDGRVQDAVPAGQFTLPVEDVFAITGRGTIVTGRITSGTVRTGDQVLIMRAGQPVATTRVTAIEAFRKTLTAASAGENVGLLLEGIDKSQVLAGDVISH
ncbi:EF-Tu/IF-2/RF-3 family GTPase [Kribbella sp. CA-293567]|uniref:EF-Tu/IF-2/RF-3 family GTPase n=1 Tax=Kribbella sp. CA-293567 TaxID=3002436 RepID=UPI0022DE5094|nr:EF-Tu/IF-2/RF-3 family GTPase [Kribbella sp. CA-293567]WBQ03130.1 EF-Tu/IF-2/RF-3 family GTPase [Kribbella sp. CA-293567]